MFMCTARLHAHLKQRYLSQLQPPVERHLGASLISYAIPALRPARQKTSTISSRLAQSRPYIKGFGPNSRLCSFFRHYVICLLKQSSNFAYVHTSLSEASFDLMPQHRQAALGSFHL